MDPPDTTDQQTCSPCRAGWRFPVLLAVVLIGIVLAQFSGFRRGEEVVVERPLATSGNPEINETVSLVVDFGDDRSQRFEATPWHQGMTIEDLLGHVSELPTSPEFAKQGSGESALLTRIGDLANEGAGGRNWTYEVNNRRGDRSFAIYRLAPGDSVLWKFGPQE